MRKVLMRRGACPLQHPKLVPVRQSCAIATPTGAGLASGWHVSSGGLRAARHRLPVSAAEASTCCTDARPGLTKLRRGQAPPVDCVISSPAGAASAGVIDSAGRAECPAGLRRYAGLVLQGDGPRPCRVTRGRNCRPRLMVPAT